MSVLTIFDDANFARILNGAQAMRYDHARSTRFSFVQSVLHNLFRLRIQGAGRLVQA